jgi:hypothetical protein
MNTGDRIELAFDNSARNGVFNSSQLGHLKIGNHCMIRRPINLVNFHQVAPFTIGQQVWSMPGTHCLQPVRALRAFALNVTV